MKKTYYLPSCDTCQRILKETNAISLCTLQDIKTQAISPEELDWLATKAGSYENLFSRRSLKYRAMGLHEKILTENDYRSLILQEYTFLKRPVIIVGEEVFVGNLAKTVADAKKALQKHE